MSCYKKEKGFTIGAGRSDIMSELRIIGTKLADGRNRYKLMLNGVELDGRCISEVNINLKGTSPISISIEGLLNGLPNVRNVNVDNLAITAE